MMQEPPPSPGPWWPALLEWGMASAAAGVAGYVKAKGEPRPFSLPSLTAKVAEAIVCGFIAAGIAAYLETRDPRMTVAISSALGLIGTGVLSDLVVRWMTTRSAGKP